MADSPYKIDQADISAVSVKGRSSTLQGTVAENQQVFDDLGEMIIEKYNAFVDHVETDTGTTIDEEVIEYYEDMGWTPDNGD